MGTEYPKRSFACPSCRVIRRVLTRWGAKHLCPTCGQPMIYVQRPPKRTDDRGWATIRRRQFTLERAEHAMSYRVVLGWRWTIERHRLGIYQG